MSQWMPHNIQKRLLRYVLGQLSLFSEIDLPDVDVSLGANSKVSLRGLQLDTDKFDVPGVYLRNGSVDTLELTLTMSDGVCMTCTGVHVTLTPTGDHNNTVSHSQFSLQKSTLDLARSTTFDDYVENEEIDEQSLLEHLEKSVSEAEKPDTESYKLTGMMAKATEYALSKLQVQLKDVVVTVVADPANMEVAIRNVSFSSDGDTKRVSLEGVEIRSGGDVYSGEGLEKKAEQEVPPTNDDDSDTDSDNDMLMSTSFMAETKAGVAKSIMESAMNSHHPGSSVFMSAQTQFFDAESTARSRAAHVTIREPIREEKRKVAVGYIDHLDLSFSGLQQLSDVAVEVGTVRLTAAPVPDILAAVLTFAAQMRKVERLTRTSSEEEEEEEEENSSPTLIKSFNIDQIELDFVSGLKSDGQFALADSARLLLSTVNLEQKNENYFFGSVNSVKVGKKGGNVLTMSQSAGSDITFEIQKQEGLHWIVMLPKEMHLGVDNSDLLWLYRFCTRLKPALALLQAAEKPHRGKRSLMRPEASQNLDESKTEFTLTTGEIFVRWDLGTDALSLQISPVSYNSAKGTLSIESIVGHFEKAAQSRQILSVRQIQYTEFRGRRKGVRGFDGNTQQEFTFKTESELAVDGVEVQLDLAELKRISQAVEEVGDLFASHKPPTVPLKSYLGAQRGRRRAHIANSLFLGRSTEMRLNVVVGTIDVTLHRLGAEFGGLVASVSELGVGVFRSGVVNVYAMLANVRRVCGGKSEYLVEVASFEEAGVKPVVFAKLHESATVYLRNVYLNYYASWVPLFGDPGDEPTIEEEAGEIEQELRHRSRSVTTLLMCDVIVGLIPGHMDAQAALVVKKGNTTVVAEESGALNVQSSFNAVGVYLVDDRTAKAEGEEDDGGGGPGWTLAALLKSRGFANVGYVNTLLVRGSVNSHEAVGDREFRPIVDLRLEADTAKLWFCADSFQCFTKLCVDLKAPVLFTFDERYKTSTEEAVDTYNGVEDDFFTLKRADLPAGEVDSDDSTVSADSLRIVEDYYERDNSQSASTVTQSQASSYTDELAESANQLSKASDSSELPAVIPLAVTVTVKKLLFSLYDGYDWLETRTQISEAMKRVEAAAEAAVSSGDVDTEVDNSEVDNSEIDNSIDTSHTSSTFSPPPPNTAASVVGETLFQSIYLGVHPGDPIETAYDRINASIDASFRRSTSTVALGPKAREYRRLRLRRSRNSKVNIELEEAEVVMLLVSDREPRPKHKPAVYAEAPSELVLRLVVNAKELKVLDNVPSSSWNMFLGYQAEAGMRETGVNMVHFQMDFVRPVPELAATEFGIHVSVLPLRLYVDQDTLEFVTRFFEFHDSRFDVPELEDEDLFLEKVKVDAVKLKLDYKPKKVDYAGIRSGHTDEFMNFFVLEESSMTLKEVTLYGVSSFDRLNTLLNACWTPDIKRHQLGGVLAGVAPVKSLVKLGGGFKDLVMVPIKEYKKDGRIMRSLEKGAVSFGKTTSGEMLRLGVKLAAGTQSILENAEQMLGGEGSSGRLRSPSHSSTVATAAGSTRRSTRRTSSSGSGGSGTRHRPKLYELYGHRRESRGSVDSYGDEDDTGRYARYYLNQGQGQTTVSQSKLANQNEEAIVSGDEFGREDDESANEQEDDEDAQRVVSLYSNQPKDLNAGLKSAYRSLERNVRVARDAMTSAGSRASASGSAQTAMMELARATPVMIIRPLIGTTEAISRTLLGGLNDMDPEERRKAEEKYKK